jgi:homoserine/homoserine lactone efflux protein
MNLYLSFFLIASLTILSPGPGVAMTLSNALQLGRRATLSGIVGLAAGSITVALICASSLGIFITHSPKNIAQLKLCGALYLIYLGLNLWRASNLELKPPAQINEKVARKFFTGLSLQLMNPATVLFFITVLPQFINYETDYFSQFTELILIYGVLMILIHCTYAKVARRAKQWFLTSRGLILFKRASGTVFCLAGMLMIAENPILVVSKI